MLFFHGYRIFFFFLKDASACWIAPVVFFFLAKKVSWAPALLCFVSCYLGAYTTNRKTQTVEKTVAVQVL